MKDDGGDTTGIVIEEAEIVDCEGESKPYFYEIFESNVFFLFANSISINVQI